MFMATIRPLDDFPPHRMRAPIFLWRFPSVSGGMGKKMHHVITNLQGVITAFDAVITKNERGRASGPKR
jgi:hypothetical protein